MTALLAAAALTGTHLCAAAQTSADRPDYVQINLGAMTTEQDWWVATTGYAASVRWGRPLTDTWHLQVGGHAARNTEGGNFYERRALGVDAEYDFDVRWLGGYPAAGIGTGMARTAMRFGGRTEAGWSPYISVNVDYLWPISRSQTVGAEVRYTQSRLRRSDVFGPSRGNPGMTYWTLAWRHTL
ncbi:hypothetical protein IP84_05480 [beta proteobacterium AAP99]|nr:hypothetical protein IP84_05480 [beta proteobacterium AAP99]